jgi:hypothetical protein
LAVFLAVLAAYIDWSTWIELNVSVVYGLPLVVSVATRNRRLLWGLTTFLLITTFVVHSLQVPPGRFSQLDPLFIDRLLAATALLVIACVLHYRMTVIDTLEAQRRLLRQQNEELDLRRHEAVPSRAIELMMAKDSFQRVQFPNNARRRSNPISSRPRWRGGDHCLGASHARHLSGRRAR